MSHSELSPDWEAAGLFDPAAPNAEERRELLAFFDEVGWGPNEFAGFTAADHLSAIASRRSNRPGRRMDRAEATALSGLSPEDFNAAARASGYPSDDTLGFTEEDARAFQLFHDAASFFSTNEMLHFTSVMGSALGRIAEAATALFRLDVSAGLEAEGGRESAYARKNHEAARLLELMKGPLWALFLAQLEQATTRADLARQAAGAEAPMSTVRMSVGFVDLVGYTQLSERMAPDELSSFLRVFEEQAYATVADHGGRVVKLIGDEVMFVAVEPNDGIGAALALQQAFASDDVVPRAGVGFGDLIARGGDYYGPIVNLAARIAECAIPGELLVDEATAKAADAHEFEPAGRRLLKGFAEPHRLAAHVSG